MAEPTDPNWSAPGAGPYDAEATAAREACGARGVVLMVRDGKHGDGFEVQMSDPRDLRALPRVLRDLADQVERQLGAVPIAALARPDRAPPQA